ASPPPPPPLPASSPPPTPASDSKFSPPLPDAPVVVTAPPPPPIAISTPSPPSTPEQTTPPGSPLSAPSTSTPAPSTTAAPPPPATPTQTNTSPPPAHSSLPPPTASSAKNSTASPSTTPSSHSNDNSVAKTLVGITIAGVLVALAVIFFLTLRKKKKKKSPRGQYRLPPGQIALPNTKQESLFGSTGGQFSYDELMGITNGFSRDNHIGEGGFGPVYKGTLPDGRQVAVKQLKIGSGQGEREFRAEVDIISRIHHRHLVSLVGYCIVEHHRLLVYEFVSNKTLEHHLHGKLPNHNLKFFYDFRYLAPEYASSGKLTDRSDVYSFGVVLLELITGRMPVDPSQPLGDESLVEWARPLLVHALDTGNYEELVDPKLENNFAKNDMLQMIEAAAACVRHSAPKRPRMVQIAFESSTFSIDYDHSTEHEHDEHQRLTQTQSSNGV
ncbi:hypothetical protein GW17_00012741, partial [Ensete ventricosum]